MKKVTKDLSLQDRMQMRLGLLDAQNRVNDCIRLLTESGTLQKQGKVENVGIPG